MAWEMASKAQFAAATRQQRLAYIQACVTFVRKLNAIIARENDVLDTIESSSHSAVTVNGVTDGLRDQFIAVYDSGPVPADFIT